MGTIRIPDGQPPACVVCGGLGFHADAEPLRLCESCFNDWMGSGEKDRIQRCAGSVQLRPSLAIGHVAKVAFEDFVRRRWAELRSEREKGANGNGRAHETAPQYGKAIYESCGGGRKG